MRRQHDFFALIRISKHLSSLSQALNKLCSSLIDGAIKRISSAYNTINDLGVSERVVRMSKYIANKKGDKTEPCLTPNFMAKVLLPIFGAKSPKNPNFGGVNKHF